MKLLNGSDLASYIKQRHVKQAAALRSKKIYPKLANVVQLKDDPVINTYVELKKQYGADIGVDVEVFRPSPEETPALIRKLNKDPTIHGVIIQLPLPDPGITDGIVNLVAPDKDVDALGDNAKFEPATPMAILWLLAGYNIDLKNKKVLLIGKGKLVGAPLERIFRQSGINVSVATRSTKDLPTKTLEADVIISAANEPGILNSEMIKRGAVVVDAGVAGEGGKTTGNVTKEVFERDDLTITPQRGGVGPLTVCALFENVLRSAQKTVN